MDLDPSLEADEQSFEVVQPGEGALDDPAKAAEARAVSGLAARDLGIDASAAELASVRVGVVAAVGEQPVGSPPGSAHLPGHGWDRVDEGKKLGYVVAIGGGDTGRQR